MRFPIPRSITLLVATLGSISTAQADDATLPPVEVSASRNAPYLSDGENSTTTVYQAGRDAIQLFGGSGGNNANTVVDRAPSVNAQTADAYGYANIPAGAKGIRVRGEISPHGDNSTVEGLPLSGINPGPGSQWLFDLENIAQVSLRQGPISPDHLAFFTTGGVLDRQILWPQAHRALQAAQSLGSNSFSRTFARGDSGELADGSRLFLSSSYIRADKWRGPGQAPAGRANIATAWSRPLGERGNGKLLFVYNTVRADNYRPLTYSQASDLNNWRYYDYSATSSATPANAVHYYGYNRQDFQNWSVIGEYRYALGEASMLTIKPYYMKEKGEYFDGMATGKIRQWLIDHDWYGVTAEVQTRIADTDLKLGYWNEASNPPGPPTAWKMYNPTATGGLTGATWSILASPTEKHRFNSFYALADHSFGALKIQAGGRYVRETLPGFNFFNTAGIGDVSYQQALAQSKGMIANRSANSFSISEFLPFAALDYKLTPSSDLRASIGRTYGAPVFDIWPVFQQNSAVFLGKGLTADKLWHSLVAETANAIDIGMHVNTEQGYFEPTLFYSRNHHKGVTFDPGIGVAYSQNVGETHAYGVQATSGYTLDSNIDLFAGASYTRNVFDRNLPLLNGGQLAVIGRQLPDTPKLQANIGGTWQRDNFSVTPMLRYTGSRYGDTQQVQRIAGYATLDLTLGYKEHTSAGNLNATLSVQNLFDKQYIGFINASYYQMLSNTNAYYYPGAPRTIVARLTLDI